MTLENVYYVGQTIAVVAILGSLLAIFFQQRQTNKIARVDITQRVSSGYGDSMRSMMSDPGLAAAFRKVMFDRTELTPVEKTQILIYFNLTLTAHADAYLAYTEGLIDRRALEGLDHNTCWYLTAPQFAREWRRIAPLGIFNPEFVEHVKLRKRMLFPDDAPDSASEREPRS